MPDNDGLWSSMHFELPSDAVVIDFFAQGKPFSIESISLNLVNLVPEPSSLPLFGAGLLGLIGTRRRKSD